LREAGPLQIQMILEAIEQEQPRGQSEAIGAYRRGLNELIRERVNGAAKVVAV